MGHEELRIVKNAPARRGRLLGLLAMAGFLWAIWGFANQYYVRVHLPRFFVDSILVGRFSEIFAILVFGLFAIRDETNPYTRRRLLVLLFFMATMWGAIPICVSIPEPTVGNVPWQPTFPGVHAPGAVSYFVWLALIFLFGRRVDCAWCCPCVGIRETVGRTFREATIKTDLAWKLRHVQWVAAAAHVVYLVLIFAGPSTFADRYFGWFWRIVPLAYFLSFLFVPLMGNRNFCRYLCPHGSLYGLVSVLGFFRIEGDASRCIDCGLCEQQCDMGVPVRRLIREQGRVRTMTCMGCGRCASVCPSRCLELRDVRDLARSGRAAPGETSAGS